MTDRINVPLNLWNVIVNELGSDHADCAEEECFVAEHVFERIDQLADAHNSRSKVRHCCAKALAQNITPGGPLTVLSFRCEMGHQWDGNGNGDFANDPTIDLDFFAGLVRWVFDQFETDPQLTMWKEKPTARQLIQPYHDLSKPGIKGVDKADLRVAIDQVWTERIEKAAEVAEA